MIEFGAEVRDIITGFTGIYIAKATYITGCDQYLVQPRCEEKTMVKPESFWIDSGRIEVIAKAVVNVSVRSDTKKGADISAPKK